MAEETGGGEVSKPTCGDCRFFEMRPVAMVMGNCHRHPPQVVIFPATSETLAYHTTMFPDVHSGGWCGEHKPKEIIVQCNRCGEDLHGREDMAPGYKPLCVTCGQRLMAEKEALAK